MIPSYFATALRNMIHPLDDLSDKDRYLFGSKEQSRFVFGRCPSTEKRHLYPDPSQTPDTLLHARKITRLSHDNFKQNDRSFEKIVNDCKAAFNLGRVATVVQGRRHTYYAYFLARLDGWLSHFESVPMFQWNENSTLSKCEDLVSAIDQLPNYFNYYKKVGAFTRKACALLLSEMSIEEIRQSLIEHEKGEKRFSLRLYHLLKGICRASEETEEVQTMLDHTEQCKGFPVEELYRLFIDEDHSKEYGLGLFCYEDEPGYAAAMLRAFKEVGNILANKPLDYSKIEAIHTLTTSGVLSSNEDVAIKDISWNEGSVFYKRGINLTEDGLEEITRLASVNNFPKIERLNSDTYLVDFDYKDHKGMELSKNYCQTFEKKLQEITETDSQRRQDAIIHAIVELCRNLQHTHPFRDGNARTIGCILLNGLLLREGFSPTIIDDINKFDAYSVNELVQILKKGQQYFQTLRK
ncbi:hypothetical protein [Endozoicomonas sp. ALD040]|uniref:hypothetical protein n=1 Tax=unclassified Endozoicomonas TaxID=2644528 RepID=UPI003BAF4F10